MTGIRGQSNLVEFGHQTFGFDDRRVDTETWLNPETGLVEQRPIKITPEQAKVVEIEGWRRALASVDLRIANFDPNANLMAYEEPLTEEKIERLRLSLENERQRCLDELAALGAAPVPEPTVKRRRR